MIVQQYSTVRTVYSTYDEKRYGPLKTLLGYSSYSISIYLLKIVHSTSTAVRYTSMQKMRFANTTVHTKLLRRTEIKNVLYNNTAYRVLS
jgi:hypothetical protein